MQPSTPSLLFRACSSTSAGRLTSGKPRSPATEANVDLLAEFASHAAYWDAHTPTALVSTTSRPIRAIHTAFDKLHSGEAPGDVEIIFITVPEVSEETRVHCAEDLAGQLPWADGRRKTYRDEYLFEWEIPESWEVHGITMATLLGRGLSLEKLCGRHAAFEGSFPRTREFRMMLRNHWRDLEGFDMGIEAGRLACLLGSRGIAGRLAHELLIPSLPRGQEPFGTVKDGVEEALEGYEWETWDSGEADADFEATWEELGPPVSAEGMIW